MVEYAVRFKKLSKKATTPTKAHDTDAGFDLYSVEHRKIEPGDRAVVATGIAIELPEGDPVWLWEAQVRSRSGLRWRYGIVVPVGTIDAGYRGDIGCVVFNLGHTVFEVEPGDRIGQLVIAKIPRVRLVETSELRESKRGDNGFGSSGK